MSNKKSGSNASRKSARKVTRARHLIMAGVALLAILVVGYGVLYSSGVTQGEFTAGEHYTVLENPTRRRPGAPIEVQEFFSYGCVHCKTFDPLIEQWQAERPEGVSFNRVPVAFSSAWVLLAQSYLTLEVLDVLEQNHERMFRRIHDSRGMFRSEDEIAQFVDGHGTTAEEFLNAFNGPDVRQALRESDNAQRRVGIAGVPTLVVGGKYVVTMDVGRQVALEVVDHLLELEQGGASPPES